MRISSCLIAALVAAGLSGSVRAEMIAVGGRLEVQKASFPVPKRGMTMNEVEKRFGAPREKIPPVGKPPITRWEYPGYTVYFEYHYVIDSVVAG